MPLYTYEHTEKSDCSFKEIIQKVSDEKLTVCPICEKSVKFVLANTSKPIFKGTGFYETDYKGKT